MRLDDSQSGRLLYDYDALDRPLRISSDQGILEYAYDPLGRLIRRSINGQPATEYSYDEAGRLRQIRHGARQIDTTYDAAGRLQSQRLPHGLQQDYDWDAAGRLTQLRARRADGSELHTLTYGYDAAGQRIRRDSPRPTLPETPFIAHYDTANRLTTITFTSTQDTWDLAYDPAGRLQSKTRRGDGASTRYTWDARGRLIGLDGPHGTARYQYDALGRRIRQTLNGQTHSNLHDGDQVVAQTPETGLGTLYLSGLGIDEALARLTPGGDRVQLTDALGSVLAEVDESGQTTSDYAYSPYGETRATGETGNPVRYTGREDDGTGLYYYRARYYDPQLKRFISEDPIGLAGGWNVYAYVGGNPISRKDPNGLEWLPENFPTDEGQLPVVPVNRIHGYWCGPDWTGGRDGEYSLAYVALYKSPSDPLDKACMVHDICYASCRANNPCDPERRSQCFAQCDAGLANAALAQGIDGLLVRTAMRRPGNRDPGPNAANCQCIAGKG